MLKSLLKVDQDNEYIIITDPKHGSWEHDRVDEIVVPSLNPIIWMIWSNTILPKLLEKNKVDIYHSFKHVTAFRLKAKKIVMFHGLHSHYLFPEFYKWYDSLYWKFMYSMAARNYDRLITVANAEKRYLIENLGFPENKFRVTYLAADDHFRVIDDKDNLQKAKKNFDLPDHFILFVGQIHPRKNLEGVIKGYYKAGCRRTTNHKLVIVGGRSGSYFQKIVNLARELGIMNDVLFLDHVSDELPFIYNLADLFLLPSHHEGFGIVLVEAMACGLPVVTSNIEDLSEVVGGAGVLVDPNNVSEIADAIVEVLNSNELRETLIKKGLERAKSYSWDRCARETIKIYEELLQGSFEDGSVPRKL